MPRSGSGSVPGVLSEQQEASVARAEGARREDDVGSEVTRPDTRLQATVRISVYSKASQEDFQQGGSSPDFHFRRVTLISGLRTHHNVWGDTEDQLGGYCSDSGEVCGGSI